MATQTATVSLTKPKSVMATDRADRTVEIERWVRMLMLRAGVRTVNFSKASDTEPSPLGLLDVPTKYVLIIDAMHEAIVAAADGDPLPEFTQPPADKSGRKKKR